MCLLWEGLERNRLLHRPFPGLPSVHPCLPWPGRTASWQADSSEGCVCFCDYHPSSPRKRGLFRERERFPGPKATLCGIIQTIPSFSLLFAALHPHISTVVTRLPLMFAQQLMRHHIH